MLVSRTKDQVTLRLTVDGGWWGHAYVKPQRDGRPDDRLRLSYVSSYRHGGRTGAGTFLTLAAVSWFLCVEAPRISWMSLDDTLAFYEKFLERFGSAFGQEGIRISRPTPCDFALDKIRI